MCIVYVYTSIYFLYIHIYICIHTYIYIHMYTYIYICEWGKRWSTPGFEVSALFWDKLLGIKTAFFAQNGEFIWMVLDSFRSYWYLVSSPSDVVLTRYIQTVTPCCSPLNILRGACWRASCFFWGRLGESQRKRPTYRARALSKS